MVKHKFYELYGNKATLLSKTYKNTKTKLHAYCNIHQCDVYTTWDKLKLGQLGCKKCRYNKVSKTLQHTPVWYVNKCKEKGLDLPIEDYSNAYTKIKHKCSKGHIYEQRPHDHLNGQGCPKCRGNYSYTPKEYYNLCKKRGLDLPIEDYINNKIKIKHECSKGHIYKQTPSNHLNGKGCPYCSGHHSYTPKEYYNLCKEKGYDLPVEDYVNAKTKIKHKCSKGHIYEQRPYAHLSKMGCPKCNGNFKKTPEQYYTECKENGYDLPIEDYINATTKIKHKCSKGHIYSQAPDMHTGTKMQGCPVCNESHGERFIRNYLDKNNIKYIPQKKFHDLKDETYLSYDFYLPECKILIEYQGIQHYESVRFNGKDNTNLEKQQLHDNLKKEYAKDNGYKLLEIKYILDTQELVNTYLSRRIK